MFLGSKAGDTSAVIGLGLGPGLDLEPRSSCDSLSSAMLPHGIDL